MININELKGEVARQGMTLEELSKKSRISRTSLWRKIKTNKLGLDEADRIIKVLNLDENKIKIIFWE